MYRTPSGKPNRFRYITNGANIVTAEKRGKKHAALPKDAEKCLSCPYEDCIGNKCGRRKC